MLHNLPTQMQQPTLSQASMESRRKKSTSGDSFSFPSTPNPDSDFEFGSLTPDSPSSDPCRTSPADYLFFNGRLQPHSFPMFQQQQQNHHPIATTSRTSSISSKDSLVSSRSNSTNSRGSSSCSSARTSSSDSSERRLFHNKVSSLSSSSCKGAYTVKRSMVSSHHQAYMSSQRWQYITPVRAVNRDASKRRRGETQGKRKEEGMKKRKKKKTKEKASRGVRLRFGRRIFRWFVMACREFHAMEPSKVKNKEIVLQENNVNMHVASAPFS